MCFLSMNRSTDRSDVKPFGSKLPESTSKLVGVVHTMELLRLSFVATTTPPVKGEGAGKAEAKATPVQSGNVNGGRKVRMKKKKCERDRVWRDFGADAPNAEQRDLLVEGQLRKQLSKLRSKRKNRAIQRASAWQHDLFEDGSDVKGPGPFHTFVSVCWGLCVCSSIFCFADGVAIGLARQPAQYHDWLTAWLVGFLRRDRIFFYSALISFSLLAHGLRAVLSQPGVWSYSVWLLQAACARRYSVFDSFVRCWCVWHEARVVLQPPFDTPLLLHVVYARCGLVILVFYHLVYHAWLRDLTRECVESNPGPMCVESLRTGLIVMKESSSDIFVVRFAKTGLEMVDLYTAPNWVEGVARLSAYTGALSELTMHLHALWVEFHAPGDQAGADTARNVFVALIFRAATLVSLTKLLGHVPSEQVRALVATITSLVRDKDDFEVAVRGVFTTLLTAVPLAIQTGDWEPVFGARDVASDLVKATDFLRKSGNPNPETFEADYESIRLVLERLEAAASRPLKAGVALSMTLLPLRTAVQSMHASANASRRLTPFGLAVVGPPGCGKTTFVGMLTPLLIRETGGAVSARSIATYREGKFSGDFLHPWTSAVIIDDALSSKEVGPIVGTHGEFVTFLHQLVSNQPFPTETADLTGKTGRFTAPRVVCYVANQHLDVALRHVARDLDAIKRRFVSLTVLGFGKPLDGDLSSMSYINTWKVDISVFDVISCRYESKLVSDDPRVWVPFLVELARAHCVEQRRVISRVCRDGVDTELSDLVVAQSGVCVDVSVTSTLLFLPLLLLQCVGFLSLVGVCIRLLRPVTPLEFANYLVPRIPSSVLIRIAGVLQPESKFRQWCYYHVFARSLPAFLMALTSLVALVWYRWRRDQRSIPDVVDQAGRFGEWQLCGLLKPYIPPPTVHVVMSDRSIEWVRDHPLDPYPGLATLADGLPKLEWQHPLRLIGRPPMSPVVAVNTVDGVEQVSRSMVRIAVGAHAHDHSTTFQSGLVFGRGYVLTVAHAFPLGRPTSLVHICMPDGVGCGSQTFVMFVDHSQIVLDRRGDVALFYAAPMVVCEHVQRSNLLASGDNYRGALEVLSTYGASSSFGVRRRRWPGIDEFVDKVDVRGEPRGASFWCDMPGAVGDCGGIAVSPHGWVIGVHSFGNHVRSGFVRFTRDDFDRVTASLFEKTCIPYVALRLVPHASYAGAGAPGVRDAGSYTVQGRNRILVGVVQRRSDMHSSWRKTAYSTEFRADVDAYPSLLRCVTVATRDGYKAVANPFQGCAADETEQRCDISPSLATQFVEDFAHRIISAVGPRKMEEVPFHRVFCSFGTTIKSVDPTKAAGPGWPGLKGDYYKVAESGDAIASPELVRAYFGVRDGLLAEDGSVPSGWTTFPKDELRPVSKIAKLATRFISNPSLDMYLLARAFLNPVIDFIYTGRWAFGFMVGANAATDANQMVNHLNEVAPDGKAFDGDFAHFDEGLASPTFRVIQASVSFVAFLLVGACAFYNGVVRMMASLCPRYFAVDTMVFFSTHTNPSGAVGTTLWNCIAALFYAYCAYYTMAPEGAPSFWLSVRMLIYGDDFVIAVAPCVRSWFNPATFASQVGLLFNQQVTAADKSAPTTDWKSTDEITFLKRRFTKRADGRWTLALDIASITKSLLYAKSSSGVLPERRDADCLINAYRELWLHGPGVVAVWAPRLERASSYLPIPVHFPSDADLESQFADGTYRTWEGSIAA